MLITRHAEAEAVLSDARYVPPPVRQDGAEGTLAWLRARVSRFSSGETHARRRRELAGPLSGLDPARLRSAARALTGRRGGDWRGVPTAVLAEALGVEDSGAVPAAAAGYLSGRESPEADAAAAELLKQAGIPVITLLLQAHAATEGLIENALERAATGPSRDDIDELLRETLRWDPPLTATRRLDTRTGDEVVIDLVAANRDPRPCDPAGSHLTFGHGLRPCPAPEHALALAAGVLEGLLT
ncbi:cytochrome P450 [Nonomuraea sp. MG754425]|uniref:cytochrome P450 n=1 Tax=Nonomuraea sp. MG754425 TaxID=2570319 RepID=UPI001F21DEBA|nr:cytochrome P450 [Nonomuraea sp. MG754425]MCF6474396.1 cytochrome P450 [Nonomuraea sp. MG754425]